MRIKRRPHPALQPFVECLWAVDESGSPESERDREHVLPTGRMHVVFRLTGEPLRLFDGTDDAAGRTVGTAVVGGTRDAFYVRDGSGPLRSVGAQLRPGAAEALFRTPADALAGRHTRLDELWGSAASRLHERLADIADLNDRVNALEAALLARVAGARGVHPAVAQALEAFLKTSDVRLVVKASGYSHRTLVSWFRQSVGLTPKRYCRVLRFQRALRGAALGRDSWAELAAEAGFSDQAHFTREFRAFAGITPTEYRQASPLYPNHVHVASGRR